MKILVPLDLVQPIEPVIELLGNFVLLGQSDVHLLYVKELLPAYEGLLKTMGDFPDDWDKQVDTKAKEMLAAAQTRLSKVCKSVSTEIISGVPSEEINAKAAQGKFDMTVVVPSNRRPEERFFVGSVSNRVVGHSPNAVLVGRRDGTSAPSLNRVVIGYDGSENSKEAMQQALDLFQIAECAPAVTVVHAVDVAGPLKYFSPVAFIAALEQNLIMQSEVYLAEAKQLLTERGIKNVQTRTVEGNPAGELIKVAAETTADLLIIGAQGHSAVQHFLLGSVSQNVVSHAPCSVAVLRRSLVALVLMIACLLTQTSFANAATIDDAADLFTQQAQEKQELDDMRQELGSIKSLMNEAQQGMDQLSRQAREQAKATSQEVHLIAKEAPWEIMNGVFATSLVYNDQLPGPVMRLKEGQPAKVVLHNQLKTPTSLCFHGMTLPHTVSGLPHKEGGLVSPGQTYAFQFMTPAPGTYWYHPQVIHADQMARGLSGVIVVEPANTPKTYERDIVLVLGQSQVAGKAAYFTVNGKSAPAIAPIELKNGERIRLRVVNASGVACPLYLTGHRFEVVSVNGADGLEPHVTRDTITLQPADRYDLEFTANNPGVWSLASMLPAQTNNDGKFPGGIAVVVRYAVVLR